MRSGELKSSVVNRSMTAASWCMTKEWVKALCPAQEEVAQEEVAQAKTGQVVHFLNSRHQLTRTRWRAHMREPRILWAHPTVRVLRDAKGRFWVPKEAEELHLRLCVIAHAGPAGHRGAAIALERLQERVVWRGMRKTVEDFVKDCLHCRGAKGPALNPRPLGETKFGNAPNELLHFDLLFVRRSQKKK